MERNTANGGGNIIPDVAGCSICALRDLTVRVPSERQHNRDRKTRGLFEPFSMKG
jgi:hypothetical protein